MKPQRPQWCSTELQHPLGWPTKLQHTCTRRWRRKRRKASSTLQGLEAVPEPAPVREPTESAPESVSEPAPVIVFYSPFLDEGKEHRLVAASCVFPRNAMLSSPPSLLICVFLQVHVTLFMYVTSTCALWSEWQYCN